MATTTTGRRKWVYVHAGDSVGTGFNPRLQRAYDEGRRSFPSGSNPFTSGTAIYNAWQLGYDNRANSAYKFEGAT